MSRSTSSSSSPSNVERSSSSDEEVSGTTSRRRRTMSEQSSKSDDQATRRTRKLSESQPDDKSNKKGTRRTRGCDDDCKASKSKNDERRRKNDDTPQERGAKRHGEMTTSHKAKSSKEIDYSERLGRPEPKFEPRISMYKYDPVQGVMHETAQYNDHRQRLSRARSLIDNKAPQNHGHIHQNMKRLKEKQEREDEIERDNQRLLERLVKAMTTKRVDNWNEVDNRLVKASRDKQRQRILQMAAENRKIAQRIESRQATVNSNREDGPSTGKQPQRAGVRRATVDERPAWRDD